MKPRVALYDKVYKDENCIEREVVVTLRSETQVSRPYAHLKGQLK